jgi:hypothetical protein
VKGCYKFVVVGVFLWQVKAVPPKNGIDRVRSGVFVIRP